MITKIPYLEVNIDSSGMDRATKLVSVASDDLVLTQSSRKLAGGGSIETVLVQTPMGVFEVEGILTEVADRIDELRYAAYYDGAKEYNVYYQRRSRTDGKEAPGSLVHPSNTGENA